MLRFLTAGESHGPAILAVVEGLPRGLDVSRAGLAAELDRRKGGHGRGNRMNVEKDEIEILGGIRHGTTLGSPVAIVIRNTEWPRWQEDMSPDPGQPRKRLTTPRPGHADLSGMLKYDTKDARDILERASARETAARTIVGYLANCLLRELGITVFSHVTGIGNVLAAGPTPQVGDVGAIEASPVRTFDSQAEPQMITAIDQAKKDRDTLGGIFEVLAYGLPVGVGSHVHWDRKLDARLAEALMSIQAIKAVEVGDGTSTARSLGSQAHDEIYYREGWTRNTDRAGGIEGGMSTGQVLTVKAYMKPIATLMRALDSVDVDTKDADAAFRERSDVCAVPAAAVVGEQVVAFTLADELTRMLGGDTVTDMVENLDRYRRRLSEF